MAKHLQSCRRAASRFRVYNSAPRAVRRLQRSAAGTASTGGGPNACSPAKGISNSFGKVVEGAVESSEAPPSRLDRLHRLTLTRAGNRSSGNNVDPVGDGIAKPLAACRAQVIRSPTRTAGDTGDDQCETHVSYGPASHRAGCRPSGAVQGGSRQASRTCPRPALSGGCRGRSADLPPASLPVAETDSFPPGRAELQMSQIVDGRRGRSIPPGAGYQPPGLPI